MVHELIEAFKREFWPKKQEDADTPPSASQLVEEQKQEDGDKCDYCSTLIKARAYHLHDKIICSNCLNNRYNDYTAKTFKRITNKSLEEINKKI